MMSMSSAGVQLELPNTAQMRSRDECGETRGATTVRIGIGDVPQSPRSRNVSRWPRRYARLAGTRRPSTRHPSRARRRGVLLLKGSLLKHLVEE